MSPIKLDVLLRPYEGKWVALNRARTEVLASGDNPVTVVNSAKKKSAERPILKLVPLFGLEFVG